MNRIAKMTGSHLGLAPRRSGPVLVGHRDGAARNTHSQRRRGRMRAMLRLKDHETMNTFKRISIRINSSIILKSILAKTKFLIKTITGKERILKILTAGATA